MKEEKYTLDNNGDTSLKSIIFNTFKIKYEDIDSNMEELNVIIDKPVSIYINLTSLMEKFFDRNILEQDPIYEDNYMNFTLHILNLILHYRRYIISHHGKETKIFLIYKESNNSNNFPLMKECVNTNIKIIEEVSPMIPGVYFINSKEYANECSIIEYIMLKDMNDGLFSRFHWILTKDITDVQTLGLPKELSMDILVTYLKYDSHRKINSSVFLYKGNIFNRLGKLYGSKAKNLEEYTIYLDTLPYTGNLIHLIQLLVSEKMMPIRKSYRRLIIDIVKNKDRVYIGYMTSIQDSDLFKVLYSKSEREQMKDMLETKSIDKLYLLTWIKFNVLLFNIEDEEYINSCIYDIKNRSLEEINNMPHVTPILYVDIENLIRGGDINGNRGTKSKKIQW